MTSIFLLPQVLNLDRPPLPPTIQTDEIPVSVSLHARIRGDLEETVKELGAWSRQSCNGNIKVQDSWMCGPNSCILIFDIPVEVWFCLIPDIAICFISFRFEPG